MEYECINFHFAGQKVDDSKFTAADVERLTDSLIEWAEKEGLGIGGGFLGVNDDDESPEDNLRAENARLQERVEETERRNKLMEVNIVDALNDAARYHNEHDALQARVEEAERQLRVANTETVEALNQTRSHSRRMGVLRTARDEARALAERRKEALVPFVKAVQSFDDRDSLPDDYVVALVPMKLGDIRDGRAAIEEGT